MNSTPTARPSRLRRSLLASGIAISIVAIGAPIAFAQVAEVVVTARKREENVQNIPVAVSAVSGKDIQKFNLSTVEDVAQQTPQLVIARGSSGSGADISLRGIGSSSENIGIEQSVSVNIDGVYYGQGRAIDEGTFDVSGLQVLKGPQALFYGKNATAGALAIQTNDPGSKYEGSITGGYEFNAHEPYVEGYVSGPVTDTFGLRLAFRYSDQTQGYLQNTATQQTYVTTDSANGFKVNTSPTSVPSDYLGQDKNLLLRLTGKWAPTSRLTVTGKLTYNQLRSNNNSDNLVNVYCPNGIPQTEAGLANPTPCGRHFLAAQPGLPLNVASVPNSLFSLANGQDFERYQSATAYLKLNYQGDNYTLTSTSGFQHMFNDWADNQNFTGAAEVYAAEHFVWDQFSTEERATTSFQFPVNFAGGFYFQTTHLQFAQDVDLAGSQNSAAPPGDEFNGYTKSSATTGHTYAVFGQAIWDIVKNVELTAGARYTHEIKASYFQQPYVWAPLSGLFVQYDPTNPATSINAHQVFGNWSPEVTLTYKPDSHVTLYGAYKTGYKSGGFSNSAILSTGTLPGDVEFKPETSKGFEGGIKTILMDHQLRLNVDAFDYLYSNLQVDFFNTPTFNYITLNAASARTYGVEFETEFAPKAIPGLTLHAEGAYDDSHYDQFEAPCSPAGITYEQGCNALRVVNPNDTYHFSSNCGGGVYGQTCNFMNVDGRQTALAPKWTAVIGGDYSRPVSSALKMGLAANMRVSSGYVANAFPSTVAEQVDYQPAYTTFDAVLTLGSIDDRWTLSLIGRNLTNTFVETGTQGLPSSGAGTGCRAGSGDAADCGKIIISDQGAIVENPRTVAIQLNVKY
jgi:iron complex outermembrane receptor protein